MKNFNHNVQVMSETLTCNQQMADNSTREAVEALLAPAKGVVNLHLCGGEIYKVINNVLLC